MTDTPTITDDAIEKAIRRFAGRDLTIHHHSQDGMWRVSASGSNPLHLPRVGIGSTLAEALRSLWEEPAVETAKPVSHNSVDFCTDRFGGGW